MNTKNRQRGATLLVGLVMLVVLTLLVISAVRSGNTNLRIAGNMQTKTEAEAAAQQAIEQLISSSAVFYAPTATPTPISVDINHDGSNDYQVVFDHPSCLKAVTAAGYSALFAASAPQDTYWDLKATVTDSRTGAQVTLHQGIKVRLATGALCP
jgi:Tfp pilus assembly protein PilX